MPLAYYSRTATAEFWSEHWGGQDIPELLSVARRSPLTTLIEAALPSDGLILEAGCGLGQYVILLDERGRRVVGVDWSLEALRRARKIERVALAAMDLATLGVRDGAVAAYLSLGVVEHDPAGPDRLLAEARRVLAPGGALILSVPYVNGMRRLFRPWVRRAQGRIRASGGEFYQYAFTRREVRDFLAARGFDTKTMTPYDPARLLRGALRRVRPRSRPRGDSSTAVAAGTMGGSARGRLGALARDLLYTPPSLSLLGHMILAVAVKR